MVRLRNRELQAPKNNLDKNHSDQYDPVQLYQRYIHNLQITPKTRDSATTTRPKKVQQQTAVHLKPSVLDTKRSKIKGPVRSKPSLEIQTSRPKVRPKTPATKKKPVENLEDYEPPVEKKVTFEPNEIECFFDALKETVEEVVQSKLTSMVNTVVEILTKKIEEVSNKSQKTETVFANLCGELDNKIMYYGEEHSRHFRYICMKLEYDKIFYQHINNLSHPGQMKSMEENQPQKNSPEQLLKPPPLNLFETIPSCSHNQRSQTTRANVATTTWELHAGDAAGNPQLVQTARNFSHSPSGPFNRTATASCQMTRSCPKQIDKLSAETKDLRSDDVANPKRLGQSKSVEVAFARGSNDNRTPLGIQEFLDTLKIFQSNMADKDAMAKGDEIQIHPDYIPSKEEDSTPSLMDTDDTSSEYLVSNGGSIICSDGDSTAVEN